VVLRLLREVRAGKVSVEAARDALEGVSLSEEVYNTAVDHGVFNDPEPGSIIRASISPSGDSWLVVIFALWGILWTLYWAGTLSYGLFNHWDQQRLSFHLGMTLLTIILMGIVYLRFVLPDVIVVKHRRNKYIPPNDTEGWQQYEV
jgi:hypothetical protein